MPGFNIGSTRVDQQPSATIELARQHRWRFATLYPLKDILIYAYKSGRPKVEFDKAPIHHIQDVIWFPGKHKWSPIDIVFYNTVGNIDSAFKIYEWWTNKVLDITRSQIYIEKQVCTLELLGGAEKNDDQEQPSTKAVYKYTMSGCWPSKVTPDELDYSGTNLLQITLTLEMDKATEENLAIG